MTMVDRVDCDDDDDASSSSSSSRAEKECAV